MKPLVKIDNRRLATAIVLSLAAHAAVLLSVGAPSASGSGASGGSMAVMIGTSADHVEKTDKSDTAKKTDSPTTDTPDPRPVEIKKPEPKAPTPKPVEVKKPEPKEPTPKPVEIKKPEPKAPSPKPVEIRKPEPKAPAPKPVEVKKPEPKAPTPKPVEVKKPEPKAPAPKPVEIKKPEPKAPTPKPVEVKKTEPQKPAPRKTKPRQAKAKPAPRKRAVAQSRRAPQRAKAKAAAKKPAAAARKSQQTAALRPGDAGDSQSGAGRGNGIVPIMRSPRFGRPPHPAAYPRLSVHREEEGTVIVRALVHRRGTPAQVRVWRSSGYPRLDHAALQAVRRWVFLPMQQGGRAVTAWVEIPVRFRLQ